MEDQNNIKMFVKFIENDTKAENKGWKLQLSTWKLQLSTWKLQPINLKTAAYQPGMRRGCKTRHASVTANRQTVNMENAAAACAAFSRVWEFRLQNLVTQLAQDLSAQNRTYVDPSIARTGSWHPILDLCRTQLGQAQLAQDLSAQHMTYMELRSCVSWKAAAAQKDKMTLPLTPLF